MVTRLSDVRSATRRKKLEFCFGRIDRTARILDLGCADGWVGQWAKDQGYDDIVGIDLAPPAEIVGDIRNWRELGMAPHSFDVVIALEVVEHGDFADAIRSLLKPGGRLMATTPVPRFDWVCQIGERLGVFQRRTSPHTHLVDLRDYPGFTCEDRVVKAGISQWAVLRPAGTGGA
jgi:2-polyprenyl-3-methyl-5-hydroxy-6-metoxy-1,4-benzoquinol methylase